MFGLGWGEILVILVVALVVVGPEKLPEAARSLGRIYAQVHRALAEAKTGLKTEADLIANLELTKTPTENPQESITGENWPPPEGRQAEEIYNLKAEKAVAAGSESGSHNGSSDNLNSSQKKPKTY